MTSIAVRANCFDASALVKLHVDEDGADVVRHYFNHEATKYTTPFCFYEALNVLKVKWLYRKEISRDQYLEASFQLAAWYRAATVRINDIDFTSRTTFADAQRLSKNTSLDLSDAFQILSVKAGYFSGLVGDSKTILVTGDKNLTVAARQEGIRVWNFMEEAAP
ncbi:MAG: type II toxin-antitoxin system VapC family toxin [Candidatus Manganitrophus sp.]|nr:type II toxin-antitoxin system VapC family toxin [Candidatus Manganitrophus sp.]MDC4226098.1 type II toxin-antitoxin system VapC family toxin [Candidatus Manganitrophus sp.]WDT72647.1 MAG: type II toxin-antitoxin system VapC family toxin [Candidatus Manganitrophus sp.]WDT75124.1 MAG: type II toxin-antitoxin system VapC family toxin [Candidatus Manganitrophus sp.]WDT79892.1 MAG: type II toxin-antitoxin system VapC family toxin [Candidatus Manganitrophus sp.]